MLIPEFEFPDPSSLVHAINLFYPKPFQWSSSSKVLCCKGSLILALTDPKVYAVEAVLPSLSSAPFGNGCIRKTYGDAVLTTIPLAAVLSTKTADLILWALLRRVLCSVLHKRLCPMKCCALSKCVFNALWIEKVLVAKADFIIWWLEFSRLATNCALCSGIKIAAISASICPFTLSFVVLSR